VVVEPLRTTFQLRHTAFIPRCAQSMMYGVTFMSQIQTIGASSESITSRDTSEHTLVNAPTQAIPETAGKLQTHSHLSPSVQRWTNMATFTSQRGATTSFGRWRPGLVLYRSSQAHFRAIQHPLETVVRRRPPRLEATPDCGTRQQIQLEVSILLQSATKAVSA